MLDLEGYTNAVYQAKVVGADAKRRRPGLRNAVLSALATDLGSVATAVGRHQTRSMAAYDEERLTITTAPGVDIPCYLLRPRAPVPRCGFPLVVVLHGHHPRGCEPCVGHYCDPEEQALTERNQEDLGVQAVGQGYVALVPELRGFGELAWEEDRRNGKKNSCAELSRRALMMGTTLMGERVSDVSSIFEHVIQRPDIDAEQTAVVGYSGGGTAAMFWGALEPRLDLVVLVSSFCTYRASIIGRAHCWCNVVPGIAAVGEMAEIAGLIAPRRLGIIHGRDDPIYPFAATEQAFSVLRQRYAEWGASDRCQLVGAPGGHGFYAEPVWDFVRAGFAEAASDSDPERGEDGH